MNWWQRFRRTDAHNQANIVCTGIIMLTTIAYTLIAGRQLATMHGTLIEMKRSGEQSTEQMWSAIGNMNWMARSMDWSQKVSQRGVDASVNALEQEQRAWVGPVQACPRHTWTAARVFILRPENRPFSRS